jgi:predicted RNase H-like HicB family nuclease
MRTVEEKYEWLKLQFQSHSLKMDGNRSFRFVNSVIGRFQGQTIDDIIEMAMDEMEQYFEELKQKSDRNETEQYQLDNYYKKLS